ncbi:sensor histidine kinase [Elysia marginata]|uniref:Sensor histidine kinase n=1 Tax=Elysia marginata TaxID=1093978 RepID=A0AAV4F223_9GAST|nr:sensor histidine kinase [Elysia marginata]
MKEPQQIDDLDRMSEDVDRLRTISNRFSRIGFSPKLRRLNIVEETILAINYLRDRIPKQVTINTDVEREEIFVNLDSESYRWAVENIIFNGIDAMEGQGNIKIKINLQDHNVSIKILDSGKGMSKKTLEKAFESGFTTKNKGWGLGLALVSRIIKNGHKGKIKASSKEGEGSCFELIFNNAP